MTLSFRARLTLRWVLGFGVVLTLALLAVYFGIRAFLLADLDAQLRTLAGTELASAVDEPGDPIHLHEFPIDVASGQAYAGKFVQLIDSDGRVLIQSPVLGSMPALIRGPELRDSLAGRAPLVSVAVNGRPGRMTALRTAGPERYLVAVGLFTDALDATLARLRLLLAGVWLATLGITGVLGFTLASRALTPIHRITQQAATIAQGQFRSRLDEPVLLDEIGQMTRLLNEMLARLHGAIDANRRFAADASHELRSPLTAMLGELDVTLKRERSNDEYRETMARLRERLVAMSALTEDLMLLVRAQERQGIRISEVPIRALLDAAVIRARQSTLAAEASIVVDASHDIVVYADASLLARVVDNLVTNALQHSPGRAIIDIVAGVERSGHGADWVADEVVCRVRDRGPGIPAEARAQVFERFFRLDESRSRRTGGAGLGLAISRDIVALFKGTIRIIETDGPGTTVEVRLPGGILPAREPDV